MESNVCTVIRCSVTRYVLIVNIINRRYWVFTQYLDQSHSLHWSTLPCGVDYIIYQEEECPLTQRIHYQGYVQLSSPQYYTFLKSIISANCHLEPQRAPSSDQARDYCLKDRTRVSGPYEMGTYVSVTSKRKQQEEFYTSFRDAILSGSSEETLWMDYPRQMGRLPKMFESLYTYGTTSRVPRIIPRRDDPPSVTVLIGPTGCGKTRLVYDKYGPEDLYVLPISDGFWLDGYSGQKAFLIDEFAGNMPLPRFLQIIDWPALQVPRKGGFVVFNPSRIYITSNIVPYQWYDWLLRRRDGTIKQDRTEHRLAMYRRFTRVVHFTGGQFVDVTGGDYDNL